jgi:hypothetical protein
MTPLSPARIFAVVDLPDPGTPLMINANLPFMDLTPTLLLTRLLLLVFVLSSTRPKISGYSNPVASLNYFFLCLCHDMLLG